MTMYAQAIQSGFQFAALAGGAKSAETIATYNNEYKMASSRIAANNARNAAEQNISAVNQDKILSNVTIKQKQDEAEAQARVSAALAGSSGASVDAVIGQTEVNESLAISASNKAAEQQKEQLKSSVYNASMQGQVSIQTPQSSILGDLGKAFSSFEMSDAKTSEALSNNPDAGVLTTPDAPQI